MSVLDLLLELRTENIKIWLEGDTLRYRMSAGHFPADLRVRVSERRAEIVRFLQQTAKRNEGEPIKSVRREGSLPLSFAEERLWFLHQYEPNSSVYHTSIWLNILGALNVSALQYSLNEMVNRHEILRTTFALRGDEPVQIVSPPGPEWAAISFHQRTDWAELPEEQRTQKTIELLRAEGDRTFDMQTGPLLRVTLIGIGPQEHILQIVRHHIITDAWSSQIFWQELTALYNARVAGRPHRLPPVPLQYADFAVWQRERLQGEILERELTYWRVQLQNSQPLELPTDRSYPLVSSYRGAGKRFTLDPELVARLRNLGVSESATLFITLLSVFYILLFRSTGQEDISIGTPIANRNRSELEGVMGLFLNTLVLRARPSGTMSFRQLVRHVRSLTLDAYQHQEIPFEKLVEELHPPRLTNRQPLFQTMFVLNQERELEQVLDGLTVTRIPSTSETAKFDLSLFFSEEGGAINGHLNYATDLFDAPTIRRMIGHFQTLLAGIVADPDCPIGELSLLTTTERQQLLVAWNQTDADYPADRCVHQLFEEQVSRTPDAIAIESKIASITYAELNRRSNQLAHLLQKQGIRPNDLVGVWVEQSVSTLVALLAILKAGGVYLPFDLNLPFERLSGMISDTQPKLLLSTNRTPLLTFPKREATAYLNIEQMNIVAQPDTNLTHYVASNDPAYAFFTSGSTGSPKAVLLPHRTLTNLVIWQRRNQRLGQFARTLQLSSLSFDVSLQEILSTWTDGGTLVVPSSDLRQEPPRLLRFIRDQQIERLFLPYILLQTIADCANTQAALPDSLRDIISAGETLHLTPSIRAMMQRLPHCRLHNHYGPTESHVITAETLDGPIAEWPSDAPIGKPISNTQIFLLDNHLQPVPIGVPGELYVGGAGLALGYLNRPDLTAERFLPHPFSDEPGARLYRTGDLARYREDGVIEFLGRVDRQVKIRGFRVEPGEIESVLREHPAVRDGIVGVLDDETLGKRLIAWWIGKPEAEASGDDLRSFLRQRLPDYMIPASFVRVEEFPLNPNGKIDLRLLPEPGREDASAPSASPQTPLERQLLAVWQQVLGTKNLGVDDNFFDVGGHSLLAVRLLAKVAKATGRELPVASLFYGPTIRQQAVLLAEGGWTSPWTSLVSVQPSGTRPPLFLVPPAASTGLRFAYLARVLGPDQPIYSFDPIGFDGRSEPLDSVEAIAAQYVDELRILQPDGPYLIGGMCFGAHVAFEMAQQLQIDGKHVPIVLTFDASHPTNGPTWKRPKRSLLFYARRFVAHLKNGELFQRVANYLKFHYRTLRIRLVHRFLPHGNAKDKVWDSHLRAQWRYQAKPLAGQVVLFQSDQYFKNHAQIHWPELALHGLEIIHFPNTTHRSLLLEDENVERIAEKLRQVIDRWTTEHWQDRSQ